MLGLQLQKKPARDKLMMALEKFSTLSSYSNIFAYFDEEQPFGTKCWCTQHLGVVGSCACEAVSNSVHHDIGTPPISLHYPYVGCTHNLDAYRADTERLKNFRFAIVDVNEHFVLSPTLPQVWCLPKDIPQEQLTRAPLCRTEVGTT